MVTAAAALAAALPLAPALSWALFISGSTDPADLRHAAGAVALAAAVASRAPAATLRLFLAAPPPPDGWVPAVATLVSPAAAAAAAAGAAASTPTLPPASAVGPDVTPALVRAALTGAHPAWHPLTWRLPGGTPPSATALIFLTGHGGPGFLRVGGGSLTASALRAAVVAALHRGAADRILVVADTCRAASLAPLPPPPRVTSLASAGAEEPSHSGGFWLGGGGWRGATAERFTAALVAALLEEEEEEEDGATTTTTLASLLEGPAFNPAALLSTPTLAGNASWTVTDFFGRARTRRRVETGGGGGGGGGGSGGGGGCVN